MSARTSIARCPSNERELSDCVDYFGCLSVLNVAVNCVVYTLLLAPLRVFLGSETCVRDVPKDVDRYNCDVCPSVNLKLHWYSVKRESDRPGIESLTPPLRFLSRSSFHSLDCTVAVTHALEIALFPACMALALSFKTLPFAMRRIFPTSGALVGRLLLGGQGRVTSVAYPGGGDFGVRTTLFRLTTPPLP